MTSAPVSSYCLKITLGKWSVALKCKKIIITTTWCLTRVKIRVGIRPNCTEKSAFTGHLQGRKWPYCFHVFSVSLHWTQWVNFLESTYCMSKFFVLSIIWFLVVRSARKQYVFIRLVKLTPALKRFVARYTVVKHITSRKRRWFGRWMDQHIGRGYAWNGLHHLNLYKD